VRSWSTLITISQLDQSPYTSWSESPGPLELASPGLDVTSLEMLWSNFKAQLATYRLAASAEHCQ
jgi:hypothetical protein